MANPVIGNILGTNQGQNVIAQAMMRLMDGMNIQHFALSTGHIALEVTQ